VTQFTADFKNLKRLVRFWFCLVFKDHLLQEQLYYNNKFTLLSQAFFSAFYFRSSSLFCGNV
jgi:hypothetical protein